MRKAPVRRSRHLNSSACSQCWDADYTWFSLRGRRCALPHAPSRFFNLGDCYGTAKQSSTTISSNTWLPMTTLNLETQRQLVTCSRQLFGSKQRSPLNSGGCFSAGLLTILCFHCGGGAAPPPAFLIYTIATGQLSTKTTFFFALTTPQRWMTRPTFA